MLPNAYPNDLLILSSAAIATILLNHLDLKALGDVVNNLAVGEQAKMLKNHAHFMAP